MNDNMKSDKILFLEFVKQKIINGDKKYRDLYIANTWAFLAPDNYGAETVEDIELDLDTQLNQASKEFDKICDDIRKYFKWACQEVNNIDLLETVYNWKVRDFVSEAQYQADQIDEADNHRAFVMWKRVVNIGNQILIDDMLCVTEHMSKYDKL